MSTAEQELKFYRSECRAAQRLRPAWTELDEWMAVKDIKTKREHDEHNTTDSSGAKPRQGSLPYLQEDDAANGSSEPGHKWLLNKCAEPIIAAWPEELL